MRLAAISIDVDELYCYNAIHALDGPAMPEESDFAIYRHALPRFEALLRARGIRATFFVVGQDLSVPVAREAVARLHRAGHEIANHSHGHPYDLTRLSGSEMESQVNACSQAIAEITGSRPSGFRAPGYTVNEQVLDTLQSLDIEYDSSVFPCPAYYAAKAATLAAMQLKGRQSRSILDDPRILLAPRDPYRVGRNYRTRGEGLLELPIGVTHAYAGRLPYIGTALTLAGPRGTKLLTRAIVGRPLVNLELHGIDLADADQDGLEPLKEVQPDLRLPLARKRRCLEVAIDQLVQQGYRFVTLAEATSFFGRKPRPSAVHLTL